MTAVVSCRRTCSSLVVLLLELRFRDWRRVVEAELSLALAMVLDERSENWRNQHGVEVTIQC